MPKNALEPMQKQEFAASCQTLPGKDQKPHKPYRLLTALMKALEKDFNLTNGKT
jgi:hypothetical protein